MAQNTETVQILNALCVHAATNPGAFRYVEEWGSVATPRRTLTTSDIKHAIERCNRRGCDPKDLMRIVNRAIDLRRAGEIKSEREEIFILLEAFDDLPPAKEPT